MAFVEDGRLTCPLFHGTSSIFLGSIRAHGLGGRNPVAESGVINFLKALIPLSRKYLNGNRDVVKEGWARLLMAEQRPGHQVTPNNSLQPAAGALRSR